VFRCIQRNTYDAACGGLGNAAWLRIVSLHSEWVICAVARYPFCFGIASVAF
jgi:hypothetical protein